jgi:hypothetical protein
MRIRKNVAISDSGLVFNPVTGESFSVNPIGIDIIGQLREGKCEGEISRAIMTRYSATKATAEKDLHDFLLLLKKYDILEEDGEKKD